MARLVHIAAAAAIAASLTACGGAAATAAPTPTPVVIYVTQAPTATPSPTPRPTPTRAPTPAPTEEAHIITGVLTVYGFMNESTGCSPNKGYEDINDGTNVVVKDASERTIGTAALELWLDAPASYGVDKSAEYGAFPCVFKFEPQVPRSDFYHVTIGRRDGPTESYQELAGQGWEWDLSIGS